MFWSDFILIKSQNHFFQNRYTTENSLPSNSIYDIKELKDGRIILGTDNGISVLNGNVFTNFNTKNGLANPFVESIGVSENHVFLSCYNSMVQEFEANKFKKTPIATRAPIVFLFDKNEIIIRKKIDKHLSFTRYHNKTWKMIGKQEVAFEENKMFLPYYEQSNQIIKSQNNELTYKNIKIKFTDNLPKIYNVVFRKNDVFLFGEKQLFQYNFSGKLVQKKAMIDWAFEKNLQREIVLDKNEQLWMNIQKKGVFLWNGKQWANQNELLQILENQNINHLFFDSKNRLWLASNEIGLICVPNTDVKHYIDQNFEKNFQSFLIDKQRFFVASKHQLLEFKNNQFLLKKTDPNDLKIEVFQNRFAFFYSGGSGSLPFQKNYFENYNGFLAKKIVDYKAAGISYFSKGLAYWSVQKNGSWKYKAIKIEDKDLKNAYYSGIYNFNNELYLNIGHKIIVAELIEKNQEFYLKILRKIPFNTKNYITDFVLLNKKLFIAVDNTLYSLQNKKLDSLTEINNTPFKHINKLVCLNNDLYICTHTGLYRWGKTGGRVINKNNFLTNNHVQNLSLFRGNLMVATNSGLSAVPLDLINIPSIAPEFTIKTKQFPDFNSNPKINLKSSDNYLQFVLEISNYKSSKNEIFQYKLDDSEWKTTKENEINFYSIESGNHQLQLRVRDVNSAWRQKNISFYKNFPLYQKWWFISLTILLVVFSIYYILYSRFQIISDAEKKQLQSDRLIVELRHNALNALMNPHFIFNSLSGIHYYINNEQKDKSIAYLGKLSKLIRLFLVHASETQIELSEELKRLRLYLELEQLRFPNFNFKIQNSVTLPCVLIPNMIIQPFVENAVLHGVSKLDSTKQGFLQINVYENKGVLKIEIIDNGFGVDLKQTQRHSKHLSKGISIVKERLNLLQSSYPKAIFQLEEKALYPDKEKKGHWVILRLSC